jgi:hypothetical protein
MNGYNAAALALQSMLAANPAALQQVLMAQHPWLAGQLMGGMGGMPNGQAPLGSQLNGNGAGPAGPGAIPAVDAGLTAAQFGQQLGNGAGPGMAQLNGLNGLNLNLPHPPQGHHGNGQQSAAPPNGMAPQQNGGEVNGTWMPGSNGPADSMMFYQNGGGPNGMERAWESHRY